MFIPLIILKIRDAHACEERTAGGPRRDCMRIVGPRIRSFSFHEFARLFHVIFNPTLFFVN